MNIRLFKRNILQVRKDLITMALCVNFPLGGAVGIFPTLHVFFLSIYQYIT